MAWFDLEEQDFNELLRLSRTYYREAVRCEGSRAHLAGCTMAGASLEGLLLTMVHIYNKSL